MPWPSQIRIRPRPALSDERLDFFGNRVLYFAIQDVHHRLEVTVVTEVRVLDERPLHETSPRRPGEQASQMLWEDPDPEIIEARLFVLDSPFVAVGPTFREYAEPELSTGPAPAGGCG